MSTQPQFDFTAAPPPAGDELDGRIARVLGEGRPPLRPSGEENGSRLDPELRIVLEQLRRHRGSGAPISIAGLRRFVLVREREVKSIIKRLIEEFGVPIGSSRRRPFGYFLIVTEEDRQAALRPLRGEFHSLLRRMRALERNQVIARMLGEAQRELFEKGTA